MGGQIEVIDVSGKVRLAQEINALNMGLHAAELGQGLFIVRVSSDPSYGSFYSTTKIVFE